MFQHWTSYSCDVLSSRSRFANATCHHSLSCQSCLVVTVGHSKLRSTVDKRIQLCRFNSTRFVFHFSYLSTTSWTHNTKTTQNVNAAVLTHNDSLALVRMYMYAWYVCNRRTCWNAFLRCTLHGESTANSPHLTALLTGALPSPLRCESHAVLGLAIAKCPIYSESIATQLNPLFTYVEYSTSKANVSASAVWSTFTIAYITYTDHRVLINFYRSDVCHGEYFACCHDLR
jgi:hypothetical protein